MKGIDVLFFYEHGVIVAQCKNYDIGCQGKDIKECRKNLSVLIAEETKERGSLDSIPVAPSHFYNILAPVDFDYSEEINGVRYSFNCSVIQNPNFNCPPGVRENDNPEDYKILRHPIFLDDNTMIVITTFKNENGMGFGQLFLSDYVDFRKEQKVAAKDIIEQISDHCSVNLLWSLKEAIDEEIEKHSKHRVDGKKFPLTRPEKDD